jgi:hypothetical protein
MTSIELLGSSGHGQARILLKAQAGYLVLASPFCANKTAIAPECELRQKLIAMLWRGWNGTSSWKRSTCETPEKNAKGDLGTMNAWLKIHWAEWQADRSTSQANKARVFHG